MLHEFADKAADGFAEAIDTRSTSPLEKALWNEDRSTAWRMKDGNIAKKKKKRASSRIGKDEEISLEEAARIAAVLGLIVPTRDVRGYEYADGRGASFTTALSTSGTRLTGVERRDTRTVTCSTATSTMGRDGVGTHCRKERQC